MRFIILAGITLCFLAGCSAETEEKNEETPGLIAENSPTPKGSLFIIGGGSRPENMIAELIDMSGIRQEGYGVILPMSSEEPDSSVYYARMQFSDLGLTNVVGMDFAQGELPDQVRVDSVRNASMIYISGGDQNRFMKIVRGTELEDAIHDAYGSGAVIAGTSAGAAVMSLRMITGDEQKHPDYNATFRHIQPENIVIDQGLGLVTGVIVDQHFVKRSRYNRLISAVLEHPDMLGIGIDESTAVVVRGDSARVIGESQVILLRNKGETVVQGELLGSRNIHLEVLLPGDHFRIVR
jgi:cyanophycinase